MKQNPPAFKKLPAPRIEIINLIDVLITLIAFFLMTTVLPENRRQIEIELPRAEHAVAEAAREWVIVEMTGEHELFWDGRRVDRDELAGLLKACAPDTALIIRADRACRYEKIVDLLDLFSRANLPRVSLEVKSGG